MEKVAACLVREYKGPQMASHTQPGQPTNPAVSPAVRSRTSSDERGVRRVVSVFGTLAQTLRAMREA